MAEKIAVVGSGAFGSALACIAARAGHSVSIWGRSQSIVDEINDNHTNDTYLSGLELDHRISAETDMAAVTNDASCMLLSVPTQTLADVVKQVGSLPSETILVSTCKGIDRKTGKLPHELVKDAFAENKIASLSGPSFASDMVIGKPTAVSVASNEDAISAYVASMLSMDTFRCYTSSDIKGVELGGALKNVLALAVGVARGMNLGASAEAALVARGFAEISSLAIAMGAKVETLSGLSGLGDLVLSCSSPQSRNFSYGMAMGKGEPLNGLKLAEGAFTASVALKHAQRLSIDTPIAEAVVNVLEKRITAREAVQQLLTRPLKREN
ncbi:MAG: NAD(P)H-dependent glycerol-3-phosphate dehydrogenase [Pseudomonadota bacterium]